MNPKILYTLVLSVIFLTPFASLHAQTSTTTTAVSPTASTTSLNAGFFSDIWYSSTRPFEGDIIKIFGGIYNSSGQQISGTAHYYVDGKEVGSSSFVSNPNTLTQVSSSWTAQGGVHKIQIKAVTTQALSQAESGEDVLTVTKPIVKADLKKDAENLVKKTTETVDPYAEKIADNLSEVGNSLGDNAQKKAAEVLGSNATQPQVASVVASINPIIQWVFDGVAFLVRHWAWSLLGLVVLYIIWKSTRKKNSWY